MNSMSEKDMGKILCIGNQCDTNLPGSQPSHCRRITCKALRSSRSLQPRRRVSEDLDVKSFKFHCCGNTFLMLALFHVLFVLYAGQTTQMSPCASSTFTASDIEPTPERSVRCICRVNMDVYVSIPWTSISKHKKLHGPHIQIKNVWTSPNFRIRANSVCLEFKTFAICFLLFRDGSSYL